MQRFSQQEAQDYLAVTRHRMKVHSLRMGQSILNDHPELCPCPDVYYCRDERVVLSWFHVNLVGEGAVELPMDLSMLVKKKESVGSGQRVSLVRRASGSRALGIK